MAATAGVIDGGLLLLYVEGVAIGKATSHSLSYQMSTRETTNKDSANTAEFLAGNTSWTASCDALYTFDATLAADDLMAYIKNRTQLTLVIHRTTPKNVGDHYYTGESWLTSCEINAANEGENATYSVQFQGTGALTKATIT